VFNQLRQGIRGYFSQFRPVISKQILFLISVFYVLTVGLFFIFENPSVNVDELFYLSQTWGTNPFVITVTEGKPPLPLWFSWPFMRAFGFDIEISRIAPVLMSGVITVLFVILSRILRFPVWVSFLALLSTPYFVFYARSFMYEIYIFWIVTLQLLAILIISNSKRLKIDPKYGYHLTIFCGFCGLLTKNNYLVFIATLPFLTLLSDRFFAPDGQSLHRAAKVTFCSFLGVFLGLASMALFGVLPNFLKFGKWASEGEGLEFSALGVNLIRALEFIWIDIGPGVITAFLVCLLWALAKRKWVETLLAVATVAILFLGCTVPTRVIMARYLVLLFPVMLFLVMAVMSQMSSQRTRAFVITVLLIGQAWTFYRTSLPLMGNFQAVHWTKDELDQHVNRYGPGFGGYFPVLKVIQELGKRYRIKLECARGTVAILCDYWPAMYSHLFTSDKPLKKLTYWRTQTKDFEPSDPRVLFFKDQNIRSFKRGSYIYLLDLASSEGAGL